jgi:hypothetical protein
MMQEPFLSAAREYAEGRPEKAIEILLARIREQDEQIEQLNRAFEIVDGSFARLRQERDAQIAAQ